MGASSTNDAYPPERSTASRDGASCAWLGVAPATTASTPRLNTTACRMVPPRGKAQERREAAQRLLRSRWHGPEVEIRAVVGSAHGFVGRPASDRELMGDDPGSRAQLAPQL